MRRDVLYPILVGQILFWSLFPLMSGLTENLHPASYVIINLGIVLSAFIVWAFLWRIRYAIHPLWFHILFLAYSVLMIFLLIVRSGTNGFRSANWVPFETIQLYLFNELPFFIRFYNLAANVGLFIPFGIYLMYVSKRWRTRVTIPAATIAAVELTQYLTIRGSLDIDDFILNLAGVGMGFLLAPLLKERFVRRT
ncbi:VanZ family protein [Halobacillus litoralis]|uniref:VanZ family protein n=1 Tax=Halobacillus litoralis TaxID=45668 RepID=UPI001CD66A5A|nr:VanZ family protein [Halobacillus litoralis]MCA0972369.1 VanZ family protein [Halobacillus litoralis]